MNPIDRLPTFAPTLPQKRAADDPPSPRDGASGSRPKPPSDMPSARTKASDSQSEPLSKSQMAARQSMAKLEGKTHVIAASFGGTGNGHTSRLLDPVYQSALQAKAALESKAPGESEGLAVAILAPPRWAEQTKANAALDNMAQRLKAQNIDVVIVQGDKTPVGRYHQDENDPANFGSSNKEMMIAEWLNAPHREDTVAKYPLDKAQFDQPQMVPGVTAKDFAGELATRLAFDANVVSVSDMAGHLQKAMANTDFHKGASVHRHTIANHTDLVGKSTMDEAHLVKASDQHHFETLTQYSYSNKIDVNQSLRDEVGKYTNLNADSSVKAARDAAIDVIVHNWGRLNVNDNVGKKDAAGTLHGGLLVSEDMKSRFDQAAAKPNERKTGGDKSLSDDTTMVYTYVNQSAPAVAAFVKELQTQDKYKNVMVAMCDGSVDKVPGKDASVKKQDGTDAPGTEGKNINLMSVFKIGQAHGMTNAGFGTTSEHLQMIRDEGKGHFRSAAVGNQDEQIGNGLQLARIAAEERSKEAPGPEARRLKDNSEYSETDMNEFLERHKDSETVQMYVRNKNDAVIRQFMAMEDLMGTSQQADLNDGTTMRKLLDKGGREGATAFAATQIANQLTGGNSVNGPDTENATAALEQTHSVSKAAETKASRRLDKILLPVLASLAENDFSKMLQSVDKDNPGLLRLRGTQSQGEAVSISSKDALQMLSKAFNHDGEARADVHETLGVKEGKDIFQAVLDGGHGTAFKEIAAELDKLQKMSDGDPQAFKQAADDLCKKIIHNKFEGW